VVSALDVNALLDQVDLNVVLDQVDIDRLLDRIDLDRLLARMDLNAPSSASTSTRWSSRPTSAPSSPHPPAGPRAMCWGLTHNGTAAGDSELNPAALPPTVSSDVDKGPPRGFTQTATQSAQAVTNPDHPARPTSPLPLSGLLGLLPWKGAARVVCHWAVPAPARPRPVAAPRRSH